MKKNHNFSKDVKNWFEFAKYDLKSAKWQMKGKIYTSVCYACQQAAEKSLKALILSRGKVIPKVHSLDRLISELKTLKINTNEIEKEAQELDKYYISTRYPGQYGGPEELYDQIDAQTAIISAEKILNFVKEKIDLT
jgi:HEPN domain-containing protein